MSMPIIVEEAGKKATPNCDSCSAKLNPQEHDCGFPDCVGGYETAFNLQVAYSDELRIELAAVKAENERLKEHIRSIDESLDFEPSESYQIADMANVGYSLMQALPNGYFYNNSPAEIVADLSNKLYDAEAERNKLLAEREERVHP